MCHGCHLCDKVSCVAALPFPRRRVDAPPPPPLSFSSSNLGGLASSLKHPFPPFQSVSVPSEAPGKVGKRFVGGVRERGSRDRALRKWQSEDPPWLSDLAATRPERKEKPFPAISTSK